MRDPVSLPRISDRQPDLGLGARIFDGGPLEDLNQLTPGPDHYGLTMESVWQSYGNPGVARLSARAPDPVTPRYPDLDPGKSAFGPTTLAKDSSTKAYWQYSAGPVGPRSSTADVEQGPVTWAPDPGWSSVDRAMIWTDLASRAAAIVSSTGKDVRSMMCGRRHRRRQASEKEPQQRPNTPFKANPRPDPDLGRQIQARANRFGSGLTGRRAKTSALLLLIPVSHQYVQDLHAQAFLRVIERGRSSPYRRVHKVRKFSTDHGSSEDPSLVGCLGAVGKSDPAISRILPIQLHHTYFLKPELCTTSNPLNLNQQRN
ncbi:unnamed protein product [Phytophthora lilii]|uniref:Unnamed protein product n=1 Tax=Phytophthora lilii TaxID=2077276 RepID=A0A9W6U7E8_9STRA|nr:unnamed protein product [Phytophthora lilii]